MSDTSTFAGGTASINSVGGSDAARSFAAMLMADLPTLNVSHATDAPMQAVASTVERGGFGIA